MNSKLSDRGTSGTSPVEEESNSSYFRFERGSDGSNGSLSIGTVFRYFCEIYSRSQENKILSAQTFPWDFLNHPETLYWVQTVDKAL